MVLDPKSRLRLEFLNRRKSLTLRQIYVWSKVIQDKIIYSPEFESSPTLGIYFPINSEVMTQNIIDAAIGKKGIGLPRIVKNEIKFFEIDQPDYTNHLTTGRYGLKEPIISKEISESITLLIVPGTVFDTNGYRLGYGKGYYDRFISDYRQRGRLAFAVGLAFDFQLIDQSLPYTPFDERMNIVVTERRRINVINV